MGEKGKVRREYITSVAHPKPPTPTQVHPLLAEIEIPQDLKELSEENIREELERNVREELERITSLEVTEENQQRYLGYLKVICIPTVYKGIWCCP